MKKLHCLYIMELWQHRGLDTLKQDRQCMCNIVTLKRIHETIVAVENQYYIFLCVCVSGCESTSTGVCMRTCRLTYPVYQAQAQYCLRPLWLHLIFRDYLTNGAIFVKVTEHKMRVLIFSTTFI